MMPSPLPGMGPFWEHPAFWPSLHSRFMVALADAIEACLSSEYSEYSEYYVEVEAQTYLDDGDDSLLIGASDVVVARDRALGSGSIPEKREDSTAKERQKSEGSY